VAVSGFVQVTVSPWLTVSDAGAKPAVETVMFAARACAGTTSTTASADNSKSSLHEDPLSG
jgi:hypothetical protein